MTWTVMSASAIGTSHQKSGLPCQDAGAFRLADGDRTVIGAIADGAGSAIHSEVGAKVAIDTMLYLLGEEKACLRDACAGLLEADTKAETIQPLCRLLIRAVQQKLIAVAEEKGCSLGDLACTLIAFVASEAGLVALQIGDGFLVTRAQYSHEYTLVFEPDKGELANQTEFVTSPSAIASLQVVCSSEPVSFICASTDGLERVAIQFKGWEPHASFFKPLEGFTATCTPENKAQLQAELCEFLGSQRVTSRTNDDKTLLLCLNAASKEAPEETDNE